MQSPHCSISRRKFKFTGCPVASFIHTCLFYIRTDGPNGPLAPPLGPLFFEKFKHWWARLPSVEINFLKNSHARTMRNNKCVSCRALNQNLEPQILGVHAPSKDRAGGLLQCLLTILEELELDTNKFVAVTTDDESANTEKHGGL